MSSRSKTAVIITPGQRHRHCRRPVIQRRVQPGLLQLAAPAGVVQAATQRHIHRQRLTVSKGWGVVELVVHEGFADVGKPLNRSSLPERDISILTLTRGTSVISNPKGSRVLEPGDRLLCYGRLEAMRDLVPERRRRQRRMKVRTLDPA